MSTEGGKTCFPFHPAKHSGPENALVLSLPALAPVGLELGFASLSPLVLGLQKVPIHFASLPPPPAAQKSPCVTCQTPRTQGIFSDSQGAIIALHSHPSSFSGLSGDHCLFASGRVFWWLFFPRSPSGLCSSPGNHTSSPRASAKHPVFVFSSHRL